MDGPKPKRSVKQKIMVARSVQGLFLVLSLLVYFPVGGIARGRYSIAGEIIIITPI